MRAVFPVNEATREAKIADCWAIVHSFAVGQFYLEQLPEAVEKNFRSFAAAAGEDWQIVGIFASLAEAHGFARLARSAHAKGKCNEQRAFD
ncbi:hypothetical protein BH20VER3_BH20VER3_19080 [soil metagenome]